LEKTSGLDVVGVASAGFLELACGEVSNMPVAGVYFEASPFEEAGSRLWALMIVPSDFLSFTVLKLSDITGVVVSETWGCSLMPMGMLLAFFGLLVGVEDETVWLK
jgi:hypothetical protein